MQDKDSNIVLKHEKGNSYHTSSYTLCILRDNGLQNDNLPVNSLKFIENQFSQNSPQGKIFIGIPL